MLAVAVTWSPSRSVMVELKVTRLSFANVTLSSGLAVLGCVTARIWSSVTSPAALTLTVNAKAPAALPTWPSMTPALLTSTIAEPVATRSIRSPLRCRR